ncbi:aKG-HExxH-type peptide beta-hydroxylase [Streptomyces sp. NPDC052043]|uniref:aKG-HExxH-type peptide beta-hydroxylase n=1 Tax=Streptomyces sp. NPDC052043 TaxID=3365684 RepID=UPI0037D5D200
MGRPPRETAAVIGAHVLPDPVFDSLAAGEGGREAVLLLRRARRSRNLLLLRRVLDGPCAAAAVAGADLLARVERVAPDAARAVVDASSFGTWAARAVSDCPAHRRGTCASGDLGALAAVGAVRAGIAAEIAVPVRDGTLRLPGLGTATRLGTADEALVVVAPEAGPHTAADSCGCCPGPRPAGEHGHAGPGHGCRVQIRACGEVRSLPRDPGRVGHDWQPVAMLEARHRGMTLRLPLETADPRLPALDPAGAVPAAWQGLLQPAWELLVESHPRRAGELAAGLSGIVPLPAPARGVASATSRHAFGTVLASWPADPGRLALTLLHEFQHSKLSALTDLVTLHEPDGRPWLYAPWRPDPRPPGGLLQGIYAHLGDLAFWDDRGGRRHGPEPADSAWRVARVQAQTERGLAQAATHVRLTRLGRRFLDRVAQTVHGVRVEDRPARAATRVEAGTEAVWRLRWAVADGAWTGRLVALWHSRQAAGPLPPDDVRAASGAVAGPGPEFGRWAALQRGVEWALPAKEASEAVVARPDRAERWAELAASATEEGLPGAGVLRHRAEVVRDLYLRLTEDAGRPGQGPSQDPLGLAAWLESGSGTDSAQNTGVSMSQKARSPRANTSATG